MIRHVVMFRWNEGIGDEHVAATTAAFGRLPGLVPQIRAYAYGPDLGVVATNYDYAVTGDFESVDDFLAYLDHADHQALVQTFIAPHISERQAVQFTLG